LAKFFWAIIYSWCYYRHREPNHTLCSACYGYVIISYNSVLRFSYNTKVSLLHSGCEKIQNASFLLKHSARIWIFQVFQVFTKYSKLYVRLLLPLVPFLFYFTYLHITLSITAELLVFSALPRYTASAFSVYLMVPLTRTSLGQRTFAVFDVEQTTCTSAIDEHDVINVSAQTEDVPVPAVTVAVLRQHWVTLTFDLAFR